MSAHQKLTFPVVEFGAAVTLNVTLFKSSVVEATFVTCE